MIKIYFHRDIVIRYRNVKKLFFFKNSVKGSRRVKICIFQRSLPTCYWMWNVVCYNTLIACPGTEKLFDIYYTLKMKVRFVGEGQKESEIWFFQFFLVFLDKKNPKNCDLPCVEQHKFNNGFFFYPLSMKEMKVTKKLSFSFYIFICHERRKIIEK